MTDQIQLPLDLPHPARPQRNLRELQKRAPVHRVTTAVGAPAWLVTGYHEIRGLLGDARLGRSHPDPDNAPRSGESVLLDGPRGDYETEQAWVSTMRSRLQPFFSPRHVQAMRPRVEALTGDLLDLLAKQGPPADLARSLALALPREVIGDLLGVPAEDRAALDGWTTAISDASDRERSASGLASLNAYGRELVARKRTDPGEDVVSRLGADGSLTDDEIAQLAMGVLFAGYETTAAALCVGTTLLLDSRDQWRALRDDPGLAPAAAEESLRVVSRLLPPDIRYARADLEIAGAAVGRGELVMLDMYAAAHDETVFDDPDRFDVTRENNPHLSFGFGLRYCIGAPLARLELQTALTELTRRFPEMELTVPAGELTVRRASFAAIPESIPVAW
ncbi:cytochrome P450 [Actinomadura sp. NEAU-AAG7]|uniref:cytochrome P450 n=1 Tax=Actinomadura sp. NEAU-AAG7 TaxID=2839640 RepID=UPI001BE4298E|nr:cytochrome P450 [Actinomadura sp. NEAU-AAG7]MBT2211279.1 cytochrome P450 [Actinomadura sp. NEAU-AAG7]